MAGALAGLGIVVTRPVHQADSLCKLIESYGGVAHRFPVLEIRDPEDRRPLEQIAAQLDDYDWAIFISANAVNKALDCILQQRDWPSGVRIAVIGRRSAEELERYKLSPDLCPKHKYDSEALLSLPPLQTMKGQRCVIFRGDGGREMLADTLRERGATVDYIEAYRRARPNSDATPLLRKWRNGDIDLVVVNSAQSLRNLHGIIGEDAVELLRETRLLVVSQRMLPMVERLGFRQPPILAEDATDAAVIRALLAWRSGLCGENR